MTLEDAKQVFEKCKIEGWEFQGNLSGPSGQAVAVHVKRKSDSKEGVFRYLKRQQEEDIKRFQREIKILTNPEYKHKNILNILEYSTEEPYWYISERGEDFRIFWEKFKDENADNPNLIVEKGVEIILNILSGLSTLHKAGVVHRDIKPANIVMVNGEPVLIDFTLVYDQDEERITPHDRPVGNIRFSPDQMMHRNDEVLPWFDIYMLSQIFIWMIADKSPKGWFKPLDWRFVKYPHYIKDAYQKSLRALTALCSDYDSGPKDAASMITLIKNLFPLPTEQTGDLDPRIEEIFAKIKEGKARSLVVQATDVGNFETKFPIFEKFVSELTSFLEDTERKYNNHLPVGLRKTTNIEEWTEKIKGTTKFFKNEDAQLLNLRCGEKGSGYFQINFHFFYFSPNSKKKGNNEFFTLTSHNPLTDEFLPFALRVNIGFRSLTSSRRNKNEMFYIAMDKTGMLYKFDNRFQTKSPITIEEIFSTIDNWISNPENWEAIQ